MCKFKNVIWKSPLLLLILPFFVIAQVEVEFKSKLEEVRKKTGVQGIAVSFVMGDASPIFLQSGYANIEKKTPITMQTQFRFGSISKLFVSFSVMKLVEEGKLNLEDKVSELVPEVSFANPFADSAPLKVKHLLNHTSGWDGGRLAEKTQQSSRPMSISQALQIHPDSRISRWPPGSRVAYNNTAYLVAAYIVEKASGKSFESYVKKHFFENIGMANSDYFYTDHYRQNAATQYLGKNSVPYSHLNNRAAGALNSNMSDMINFARFLMSKGKVYFGGSLPFIQTASFEKLLQPEGSLAADAGIEVLNTYAFTMFHANGHTFYGHEGSVRGSSAIIAFSPSLNFAYIVAVNGEGPALPIIHNFLSNSLTSRANNPATRTTTGTFSPDDKALSGYYRKINTQASATAIFSALSPWKLEISDSNASIKQLIGGLKRMLYKNSSHGLNQQDTARRILVEGDDPIEGAVLYYGPMTLKKISPVMAYTQVVSLTIWLVMVISAVVFAIVWLPRTLMGKLSSTASLKLRIWPLLTMIPVFVVLSIWMSLKNASNVYEQLGTLSHSSMTIFLCTVLFALMSIIGLYVQYKAYRLRKYERKKLLTDDAFFDKPRINSFVYWHSSLFILINMAMCILLFGYELIGYQSWV